MQQRKKEIQFLKEAPRHAESMITAEQSDLVETKWKRFDRLFGILLEHLMSRVAMVVLAICIIRPLSCMLHVRVRTG